ncbi:MAG: hypothetical protein EPN48_11725 [Microbacteriaceae bacterium]|nr:MAG: hypothetical protein EPN48_11725 [Microbacteriaceae bacterium]
MGGTATEAFAPEGVAPETRSIRDQIRDFLDSAGLVRTNSWVHRVSRDYARLAIQGTPVWLFVATRLALNAQERRRIAQDEDLRYVLTYADPTGETAVRHVMKDRRF